MNSLPFSRRFGSVCGQWRQGVWIKLFRSHFGQEKPVLHVNSNLFLRLFFFLRKLFMLGFHVGFRFSFYTEPSV